MRVERREEGLGVVTRKGGREGGREGYYYDEFGVQSSEEITPPFLPLLYQ